MFDEPCYSGCVTARKLGITREKLYHKCQKLGMLDARRRPTKRYVDFFKVKEQGYRGKIIFVPYFSDHIIEILNKPHI